MKLRLIILFLLTAIGNIAFAQSSPGGIDGKVVDEKGEPVPFAPVAAFDGGILKGQGKTNFKGNFNIKPLNAGTYTLKVSSVGFNKMEIAGIIVRSGRNSTQNIKMIKKGNKLKKVTIVSGPKLIDATDPGGQTVTGAEIDNLAGNDVLKGIQLIAGVDGGPTGGSNNVSIAGGRQDETLYMVDGIPIRGGAGISNIPTSLLRGVEVFKSGVPAKQGNTTSGVIEINTINLASSLTGGLRAQRSVEGFNNNMVSLNLAGPLIFKKDSNKKRIRPVMGFVLGLSGRYNKDGNPSYTGYNVLKPEVLSALQQTPLADNPTGTGAASFLPASEAVTANDFKKVKARENGQNYNVNYLGKLDFAPTSRMNVTLGTFFDYNRVNNWSFANSLFAPEANSISRGYTARGFVRLQQSLGKASDDKQDALISNAFYNLQLSYQRSANRSENEDHGRDIFKYGYVGKYDQETTPFYRQDTVSGANGATYYAWRFIGDVSTDLTYTPGGVNPLLENYTKQVMNDPRFDIRTQNQLQIQGGLRNGDGPGGTYSLYTGVGAQVGSFNYSQRDQFNLNLGASFDINQGIKNKDNKDAITHQIEFGLGYEQVTSRSYALGATNLWQTMRLLTNSHIQNLDVDNPIFIVGGNEYTESQLIASGLSVSQFDTIRFNRFNAASSQARFDKELRKKLFGDEGNTDVLYPDNLDPSTFSLDMFSADDLYNQGLSSRVAYTGYDYLGNIERTQPNFRDFWTKKDGRGDYLRPIAPYNPNYMFGYISDQFKYKDVLFSVGVRIDRFDANQNVLRDPYSLYGVRSLGSLENGSYRTAKNNTTNAEAPDPVAAGFDGTWVPYVDNNLASQPTVVGFRKGDVWYDPFGKEIADPTILSEEYANGLPIQPWLVDPTDSIKSESYKIDDAFTDYDPDIAISPRIRFTFPITDQALFYGNYDILAQYPQGRNFVTPDDYYFQSERGGVINNANLRMQKSINYTLGFEQAVTKRSKIGIEVYYIERKDQIQQQRFTLAYPQAYTSYGNRDYSSTKGFTFNYELQPTRKMPLRATVAYTLQFAEGTGSNSTSMASLIQQGQPNLRTIFPMSFDTRHLTTLNLDYRFAPNYRKGPKFGKGDKKHYLLAGMGANLLLNARSGRPYSKITRAIAVNGSSSGIPIEDGINGSRRPWTTNVDLRINKSLSLGKIFKNRPNGRGGLGKRLNADIFVYAENLLNTRNVIGVYSFTGRGDDDGFLNSAQGRQQVQSFIYPQSYTDMYNNRLNAPFNFNNPRRIYVGFQMNF